MSSSIDSLKELASAQQEMALRATRKTPSWSKQALVWCGTVLKRSGLIEAQKVIVPPLITLAILLGIWEIACSAAGSNLPAPSAVIRDTWELIVDPLFDHGGLDKGLFWHLLASLQRVALGYALAVVAGVSLGVVIGRS